MKKPPQEVLSLSKKKLMEKKKSMSKQVKWKKEHIEGYIGQLDGVIPIEKAITKIKKPKKIKLKKRQQIEGLDHVIEVNEGDDQHIKIDVGGTQSPSKPLRKGSDRSNLNGFLSLKKKVSHNPTRLLTPAIDKYDIAKLLNPSIFLSSDQIIEKKISKNWQRKRSKILSSSRFKIAPKAPIQIEK